MTVRPFRRRGGHAFVLRLTVVAAATLLLPAIPAAATSAADSGRLAAGESCEINPGVDDPTYNNTCPDWVSSFTEDETQTTQGKLQIEGSSQEGWFTRAAPNGEFIINVGSLRQGFDFSWQNMVLVATDADTGERLWWRDYPLGVLPPSEFPGYESATPMDATFSLDSRYIYVTGRTESNPTGAHYADLSFVLKVDAATGDTEWATAGRPITEYTGNTLTESKDIALSPDGDRVYVTGHIQCLADDVVGDCLKTIVSRDVRWFTYVFALDASSGDALWRTYDGSNPDLWSPLFAVSPDGTRLYQMQQVTEPSGQAAPGPVLAVRLVAYDTATGDQVWASRYDYPPESGHQHWQQVQPVGLSISPGGDRVFVTTSHMHSRPTGTDDINFLGLGWDTATGELAWEFESDWSPQAGCTNGFDLVKGAALSPSGDRLYVVGTVSVDPERRGRTCDLADTAIGLLALNTATGNVDWSTLYQSPDHWLGMPMFISGNPKLSWDYILADNVHVRPGTGSNDRGSQIYVRAHARANGEEVHWVLGLGFDGMTGEQVWQARYTELENEWWLPGGSAFSPDDSRFYLTAVEKILNTITSTSVRSRAKVTNIAFPTAGDLPTAMLTVTRPTGVTPLGVSLDASESRANNDGEAITHYRFDFGDGSDPVVQTTPTVDHAYSDPGTYTAKVMVFGARGGVARATETITVEAP